METIQGKYTSAALFLADNPNTRIDQYAISQITMLCDNETLSGSRIRIMPDVHAGKVGTIGFTATIAFKPAKVKITAHAMWGFSYSRSRGNIIPDKTI